MNSIGAQMQTVESEMDSYYDERNERWQESDRAGELQDQIDRLREILELIADWNS